MRGGFALPVTEANVSTSLYSYPHNIIPLPTADKILPRVPPGTPGLAQGTCIAYEMGYWWDHCRALVPDPDSKHSWQACRNEFLAKWRFCFINLRPHIGLYPTCLMCTYATIFPWCTPEMKEC
jgi:hypothetical protein